MALRREVHLLYNKVEFVLWKYLIGKNRFISFAASEKVKALGFMGTFYKKVEDSKVVNKIVYLPTTKEEGLLIAQASLKFSNKDFIFDIEWIKAGWGNLLQVKGRKI